MVDIAQYRETFLKYLDEKVVLTEPKNLYEPIVYILQLGGKRLRPVLTLMTAEIFGISHKKALDAALAVEVFHNFSLVHDDIMDDAPLRRGKETVHEKWDLIWILAEEFPGQNLVDEVQDHSAKAHRGVVQKCVFESSIFVFCLESEKFWVSMRIPWKFYNFSWKMPMSIKQV